MTSSACRVVKVGGSLFDFPRLPAALSHWLATQPPASNILVAGGGKFADAVRQIDETFTIGESEAHWMCIDLMSTTARLLASIVRPSDLITQFGQLRGENKSNEDEPIVFDTSQFLRNIEPDLPGTRLAHNWSVTSDSIAARLAIVLQADELVLLKSSDPRTETGSPFVDAFFPTISPELEAFRAVNLRAVL